MYWDDNSSRAVIPSVSLQNSTVPVLATREIATNSPFPYGLGLYQRSRAGAEIGRDLFYVSDVVAKARGRGVLAGWYCVATPGEAFSLRLTNVHQSGNGFVNQMPLDSKRGACAEVVVDGVNPLGGTGAYQVTPAGSELVIAGFTESENFPAGQISGNATVRQFRFSKIITLEEEDVEEDVNAGSMQLRIYTGPLLLNIHSASYRSSALRAVGKVKEKSAVKLGRSVQVEREGERVQDKCFRSQYSVQRGEVDAVVNIYMREKYWLESRSIIDKDGNAFKPKVMKDVIVLENEEVVELVDEDEVNKKGGDTPPVKVVDKIDVVEVEKIMVKKDIVEDSSEVGESPTKNGEELVELNKNGEDVMEEVDNDKSEELKKMKEVIDEVGDNGDNEKELNVHETTELKKNDVNEENVHGSTECDTSPKEKTMDEQKKDPVNVVKAEDTDVEVVLNKSKKRALMESEEDGSPTKKGKTDVVDLTVVKDHIDLT